MGKSSKASKSSAGAGAGAALTKEKETDIELNFELSKGVLYNFTDRDYSDCDPLELTVLEKAHQYLQAQVATLPNMPAGSGQFQQAAVKGMGVSKAGDYNVLLVAISIGDWASVRTLINEKGSLLSPAQYYVTQYRSNGLAKVRSYQRTYSQYNLLHIACFKGSNIAKFEEVSDFS